MMMLNKTYMSFLLDCKVGAKMEEGIGYVCPANHSAGFPWPLLLLSCLKINFTFEAEIGVSGWLRGKALDLVRGNQ